MSVGDVSRCLTEQVLRFISRDVQNGEVFHVELPFFTSDLAVCATEQQRAPSLCTNSNLLS